MSADNHLNPVQFDPESSPAHENYGISYKNGNETRGVPATSKLGERNQAVRESAESGRASRKAHQVYDGKSARSIAAKRMGTEAKYIGGLRPVTPYGKPNQN